MTSAPSARPSSPKLLWPFLLLTSFLVSVLLLQTRLIGELVDGPALLFGDKSAGGSGALISITYLVPLLGAVFGWILTGQRDAPDRPGLAAGLHVLALGTVIVGFGLVIAVLEVQYPTFLYLLAPVSAFSLFLCWRACCWPCVAGRGCVICGSHCYSLFTWCRRRVSL